MSMALPLPPRPNLEQYKKLAKDLQHAGQSADPAAVQEWAARWSETLLRLHGDAITPGVCRDIKSFPKRLRANWPAILKSNDALARGALSGAHLFLARVHGFASWPKFVQHLEAAGRANSPISSFEQAADAIVSGNLAILEKLLNGVPGLVRARSTREHRSTLLHYVSANGIEDFRQKTPANIVAIATRLLDSGAEVNAESDAYGGRSTTLELTATSCHPAVAGVQIPLLQLLLDRGASIDGPGGGSTVVACLHNGRGEAAEFLAQRGARLDLEGAAGVGRLDVVRSFFHGDGRLKPSATTKQLKDGFSWACQFGHTEVVEFLLSKVEVDGKLPRDGQSGLHWAAYSGHVDLVKLLLTHGAPVNLKDDRHNGTPLEWALYAWGDPASSRLRDYYEVVAALVRAGATLDSQWFEVDDDERRRAAKRVASDLRMQGALRGEVSE